MVHHRNDVLVEDSLLVRLQLTTSFRLAARAERQAAQGLPVPLRERRGHRRRRQERAARADRVRAYVFLNVFFRSFGYFVMSFKKKRKKKKKKVCGKL